MKKPASSAAIAKAAAGKTAATKTSAAKTVAKSATTKIVKSSKVDLASNTKSQIAGLLNARLADGTSASGTHCSAPPVSCLAAWSLIRTNRPRVL